MEEDFYEDDLYEGAEEAGLDVGLLLSVAGGLGRHVNTEDGKRVFEKDDDSLGKPPGRASRRQGP